MIILKLIFYFISGWTILAIFIDILDCFISRNPTDISWYVSNPLAIHNKFIPFKNVGQHRGLMVWLIAFTMTIFTAIFLL